MAFSTVSMTALGAITALLPHLIEAAPIGLVSGVKRDDTLKFAFGSDTIKGVNLGGWFVLEPWITPSLFEECPDTVVDEYTMAQYLGQSEMLSRMESHWSTWITESDFAEMAADGLNFVRIPIGYWSINPLAGDPYVQGANAYLAKAIGWAGSNGIKVLIDLHGAPGSQNGFDNSGRRGPVDWTQGDTVAETITTLNMIRDQYAANPAVAAIELLNEPLDSSLNIDTVKSFYMNGWGNLEDSHVAIVFHDAFEAVDYWNDWGSGMWNLVEDDHHYEVFSSGDLEMSLSEHLSAAAAEGSALLTSNKWTIAGEWSGAMTDCALWLNGRGVGARYDGSYNYNGGTSYYIGSCDGLTTGTVDTMSSSLQSATKQFIQAQKAAYEQAAGWIFWTWKTESAPEWHYQNLTAAGLT